MSPRRMDISSLLRNPSPPLDVSPPRPTDKPRTIDALLHRPHLPETPPTSIQSILNSPTRHRPAFPDSPTHLTRTHLPHTSPTVQNANRPFVGLDALVHVAAEEHRRITALSDRDVPCYPDQDNPPARPNSLRDHDRPHVHYGYPISSYPPTLHRHPDLPSPHKRARDTPPRSPSPDPRFSQLMSPSTRHHSSASPVNNYPTLRRQLIDSTPSRSAPTPLSVHDSRSIPLQHTSPFLHSYHPLQLPSHPLPPNNSPIHHSPQHLRSQRHSSPIHTPSLISASAESDTMLPRYSHGPKMAGGIEVLSSDPSRIRDFRPDLSSYQTPRRDMSVESFVSDSRIEHGKHELLKLSPLSGRDFPLVNDIHQPEILPHQVEGQESVYLQDRLRSRFHSSLDATTDNNNRTGVPAIQPGPPAECHPIRVWEEQPIVRETSRRISPVHMSSIPDPSESVSWLGTGENGHCERPAWESWKTRLPQNVTENASAALSPASREPPPICAPIPEHLASGLPTPIEGSSISPRPLSPQSQSPVRQPRASQESLTRCVQASPVLDFHLNSPEGKYERQYKHSDTPVVTSSGIPLASSEPVTGHPLVDKAKHTLGFVDAEDLTDPPLQQPSPQLGQRIPAKESRKHPTRATPSAPSPVPDEHGASPEHVSVSQSVRTESPRRSPKPENTAEREFIASERIMMDVDEELLSLVEDRPVPVISRPLTAQSESRLRRPITLGQETVASIGQGLSAASNGPLSSQPVLKGPLITDEERDRASMPPPAARNKKGEKDKTAPVASTTVGNRKKTDGTSKPIAKPKQPPKPRTKPAPKPKAKPNVVDSSSKGGILKGTANVNARSRSTSVIPSTVDDIALEPEVDNTEKEDGKLYCVCKTRYDEDRMMIACDRCDEWFHTLCVNMLDLEIDLVDQFICPPCIQKHPHLRTTWKRRCLFGLQHDNPLSPEACHKPSRGAFSKYCSDDCGIRYMRMHIAQWEKLGGARDMLWESVKNAVKREGVVVCAKTTRTSPPGAMDVENDNSAFKPLEIVAKRRTEREVARLNARLEEVVGEREFMKRELDMVTWREKVVELASDRAGKVDECGWDQRLCFGKEEWVDFGLEVMESYEDARVKVESGDDAMPLDSAYIAHGEWWCTGKKKCERHAGWQKLRSAEVSFDKETKEGILLKLTTREREIRKCIEDLLYPQANGTLQTPSKLTHLEVQHNGLEKHHPTRPMENEKKRTS